jgi:hypothetical protein
VHDDDLENLSHEQEAWRTTTISFEFPQSLKNSTTMFQAVVRQPATTDPIDGPTRPLIRTSSTTTRSSGKYSTINRSTTIKSGSSSSSRTPLQLRFQHSSTAKANLRDKLGLALQNWCALSDQQATCHHLRRNLFKSNHQGTTSLNEAV